ncbi:MAG: hypothetical protein ACFE9L_03850 [Candidatus Hodarchaeota archaeon]
MKWTDKESPKTAMVTLNLVSGITLWEEMVRDRREFCLNACQNNKVVNMLRPKCTDRRYLDVLLLKRESKKNMPLFCYSQRIKGLIRSFQEGESLLPDVYIYIDDYWKIVHEKKPKIRRSASYFVKRTLTRTPKVKEVLPIRSLDQLIETHYLRDQIFILWPKLELCLVNAYETSIHSMKMFKSIVDALADFFGLDVSMDIEGNFIELKFENLNLKDSVIVEEELQKSSAFTGFSATEIWVEIQLSSFGEEELDFRVKDLHFIFKTVADVTEMVEEDEEDQKIEASLTEISDVKTEQDRDSKVQ